MQVLGDLLKLPSDSSIPLPWWHRAPLGLIHDTTIHVAITEPGQRPVGDLLVSVLDCGKWPWMFQVNCQHMDQPGVLAKAFSATPQLNIALAEAATILAARTTNNQDDLSRIHDLSLICEPPGSVTLKTPDVFLDSEVEATLRELRFQSISIDRADLPPLVWTDVGRIAHGWIDNVDWRGYGFRERFESGPMEAVDIDRAVVSADTRQRVLRFVFPYKGARTVSIEHRDDPGILAKLTEAIMDCDLNILSAFLRRGGAERGNALLVAACEPLPGTVADKQGFEEKLHSNIRDLPHWFRAQARILEAREAHKTIYPQHPDDVVARAPDRLRRVVRSYRAAFSKDGQIPVFVSRRFLDEDRRYAQIVREVHGALERNGCQPVEAKITTEDRLTTPDEVEATMWACKAAIVLIAGGGELEKDESFSANLAQEYGFFRGQGKPILPLIEKGYRTAVQERWTNPIGGLNFPHFSNGIEAFDKESTTSIERLVTDWLDQWVSRRR